MEEHDSPTSDPQEEATSTTTPSIDTPADHSSEATASAHLTEASLKAAPATVPLTPKPPALTSDASAPFSTSQPSRPQSLRALTRRQALIGAGIAVGVAAIGTGITLAALIGSSSPDGATSSPSAPGTPFTVGLPTPQTPVSEDTLRAWRTKQLTAQPGQRFQYHSGTGIVPLGVLEPTYPNPYNPYHVHLQGYILGGALVAKTQFFLYLGLESLDGSQFVAKVRVGPVDQPKERFGLLVLQQSTDDIEGGPAEFPQVSLAPKALYQAVPALVGHCIEFDFIRQPLPANQGGVPPSMLPDFIKQAPISDRFLQADYEAIHHTPLGQLPTSTLGPINHLIDDSPITYHSSTDAGRYPLVSQLILRRTDQLYSKLVSG